MRVYVTGATGFLGRRVVQRLLTAGHDVVALTRDPARVLPQERVEARRLDLLALEDVLPAIEDCEAGIHAAGVGPEATPREMQDANVQASRHLAAACRRRKTLGRLVAVTSAAIEEDGDTEYRRAKLGQEAAIRSYDIEYTLLRPTLVIGPWRESRALERLVERLAAGTFRVPAGGARRIQPVHVDDVAAAAVAALGAPESVKRHLVIAGPEEGIPYREFLREARDRTGGAARIRSVPILPMRVAALVGGVIGLAPPIRAQIAFYSRDHLYPLDDARRLLGYQPQSYAAALADAFGPTVTNSVPAGA